MANTEIAREIFIDENKKLSQFAYYGEIKGLAHNEQVTVHILPMRIDERDTRQVMNMDKMQHQFVAQYERFGSVYNDIFTKGKLNFYIVTQYYGDKTLKDAINLDAEDGKKVIKMLAEGLQHIHSKNVVHRDLQPETVHFIENPLKVIITGFGKSKEMLQPTERSSYDNDTSAWRSPEMLHQGEVAGKPADIFSLGLISYYILSKGKHPFGSDEFEQASNISGKKNPPDFQYVVQDHADLLRRMLQFEPSQRPQIEDILNDDFFKH